MNEALSHFNQDGQAHMVDIAHKNATQRMAKATGRIKMMPGTLQLISSGSASKGDVLGIARIAAIQGSKRTAELIPLCHPLALTHIAVEFQLDTHDSAVECTVTAETLGRTGVEMEALTAVSVALLTIYDMCKSADRAMHIERLRLLEKQGGRSGHWQAAD